MAPADLPGEGQEELLSATRSLDPDDSALWTRGAKPKPKIGALYGAVGLHFTAEQRDWAWEIVSAEQG